MAVPLAAALIIAREDAKNTGKIADPFPRMAVRAWLPGGWILPLARTLYFPAVRESFRGSAADGSPMRLRIR